MPAIPSIYLLCAAAALVAGLGFLVFRKITKPINLEEHQGFLDAMLNIVGTLISILLGLLVAAALDRYHNLEQSVDTEAANVMQLYRLSAGLPKEEAQRIRKLSTQYCHQVVTEEWPAMAEGNPSQDVIKTYVLIVADIVKFRPSSESESNLHNAMLSSMQQIGDCRRQRILILHSVWIKQLMPVLLICSGILLAFSYLYVRKGAMLHAVMIGLVAVALGGNLGLVFLLANPFAGDWKIRPTSFELNERVLHEVESNPELMKLMESESK